MEKENKAKKFLLLALILIPAFVICLVITLNTKSDFFNTIGVICMISGFGCLIIGIFLSILQAFRKKSDIVKERNLETTSATYGTLPNGMVYKVDGVRGRQLEVYKDRCVLRVSVTAGSLITGNYSDGEKTIYYTDCIGVQFKESGLQIGYLQLETATGLMNNRSDNFFNENSFTFDKTVVTNDKMREIANFIREKISEAKSKSNATVIAQVSSADELKKFKDLLDDGVITQEEFDAKKKQLLGL